VPLHRLFGLTVHSDFALPSPAVQDVSPDVSVVSGPARAIPDGPPPGLILAETKPPLRHSFTTHTEDGYTIRYGDICDVLIDSGLTHVELRPASEEMRALSYVLFSGNVMATLLTIAGECVLHASGIESNGRVMAFIGHSGAGKSTLAALLCSEGATLIADDVLRLVPTTVGFECFSGSHEIRLRAGASSLASLLPGTIKEEIDGRTGVALEEKDARRPVHVLMFPKPSRTVAALELTQLAHAEALMALTRYPRTLGWVAHDVIKQSFRWNVRLAREVPAYDAVVPWGPPFDPEVARTMLSLLEA
jgi:hypothetical protein